MHSPEKIRLGKLGDPGPIKPWAKDNVTDQGYTFETYELKFTVPIDYTRPRSFDANKLSLSFKLITEMRVKGDYTPKTATEIIDGIKDHHLFVFLCGGPGANNQPHRIPLLNKHLLQKGYWILFPDYRGTGDSSTELMDDTSWMMKNIWHFRQTDIVRDLESFRRALLGEKRKWTTFGQSYGGWITMSYLSRYPEGLQECFVTSGMPPIGSTIKEHFSNIYHRIIKKNEDYYTKHHNHKAMVKDVVRHLLELETKETTQTLRGDGSDLLTARRFLAIGRSVWGRKVLQKDLSNLVEELNKELMKIKALGDQTNGHFSDNLLENFLKLDGFRFGERPLAALLYEAMFVPEQENDNTQRASQWTAYDMTLDDAEISKHFGWVGEDAETFAKRLENDDALYFAGEMIYPCWFEAYKGLNRYHPDLMEGIQNHVWTEPLYDPERLRHNEVSVTAVVTSGDVYVDFELSKKAAEGIKNLKLVTDENWAKNNQLEHGDLNHQTGKILKILFSGEPGMK
ncbi:Alpha/Beta hydrolase protein [Truncatella angustata]|uniref:Alpha/Beta hydrolase protein n=1 Tax=Truncatella angustata TaxID=152316 RepID=A0A9P8UBN6_9PEZI|nr:Alpha/Beta hydrolase protein [Truncatella angustata]KAH6645155.1 Alpha/Beta hydrolase protein [Truncatella angustata]